MCSVFILVTSSTCSILCCLLGCFSPSFLKRSYLLNARSVPWRNWEATLGFFPTEMSRRVPGLSWSISQPLRLHREPPASSPAPLRALEGVERQPAPTTQLQVKASAGTLQISQRATQGRAGVPDLCAAAGFLLAALLQHPYFGFRGLKPQLLHF